MHVHWDTTNNAMVYVSIKRDFSELIKTIYAPAGTVKEVTRGVRGTYNVHKMAIAYMRKKLTSRD